MSYTPAAVALGLELARVELRLARAAGRLPDIRLAERLVANWRVAAAPRRAAARPRRSSCVQALLFS